MNVKQSVALVTGANRGIGKSIVEELIKAEVKKVYVAARDITTLDFTSIDVEIVPIQLDVCNQQHIKLAALQASDVNIVFNNAGVLGFSNIIDVSLEELKRNFETNFYGTWNMSTVFSQVIKNNNGGAIVNLLTLLSLASMPGMSAYNASKAAAWSMTLSLRASLSEQGVDVHSVFPGAVDTDMLAGIEMPKASPQNVAQAIIAGVNNGVEDIFPDQMSQEVYAEWCDNHKDIEKKFAAM